MILAGRPARLFLARARPLVIRVRVGRGPGVGGAADGHVHCVIIINNLSGRAGATGRISGHCMPGTGSDTTFRCKGVTVLVTLAGSLAGGLVQASVPVVFKLQNCQ
jgi:hypothetical protein